MSLPRCGLMSPSPERPRDDVGGLDASLSEADGDASDFLHRPTDQRRREVFAYPYGEGRGLLKAAGGLHSPLLAGAEVFAGTHLARAVDQRAGLRLVAGLRDHALARASTASACS